MDGKGIGRPSFTPVPPPPRKAKGRKPDVKDKEGQNVLKVKKANTSKAIPEPTQSSFSSKRKHKVKLLTKKFDFKEAYRKIKRSSRKSKVMQLYDDAVNSGLSEEQEEALESLMERKSSAFVAGFYLEEILKKGLPFHEVIQQCTLKNLQQQETYLQTTAGRLAQFIDVQIIHEALLQSIPLQIVTDDMEYDLGTALELAQEGGPEFDFFLVTNQNPLLFTELLQIRVAQGAPAGDATNLRVFARLQDNSACEIAGALCSDLMTKFGERQGLAELQKIASKNKSDLQRYLLQKNNRTLATKALRVDFEDARLHRYISISTLQNELELYCQLYCK